MACWLMALRHHMNQCQLIINKINATYKPSIKSRYSSGSNFTRGNPTISHKIWLENYSNEILFKYPRDQLDNYTVILFQYGRFPECIIIMYWRRLWALWKVECIFVYFLGYCSILPVFMDAHTSINPLIFFPIHGSYRNPRMKFNDFSMTVPWHFLELFLSSNGRIKCQKIIKCTYFSYSSQHA